MLNNIAKTILKTALLAVFCLAGGKSYAIDTLDEAIERESAYIIDRAPSNSVLAVVNIQSGSNLLSDYIMEKFPDYVINNKKNITIVDRSKLNLIQEELDFQYSGEVSDETMVSIGKKIGAQIIVTGAINDTLDSYTFSVKLLDVKTAVILGSNSTKIAHDAKMEKYLPGSQVAVYTRQKNQEAQNKRDSTVRTVKNALGIFPNGFYLGYLGSLNSPIGISLGWLSRGGSFFIDNEFSPPSFGKYESASRSSSYQYTDEQEKTAFRWNCIFGFNINIIESFLWTDIGAGIEYRRDYKLYTETSPASGSNKIWIESEDDKTTLALSAGLFVKLWYFYVQGKYKYIVGTDIDYSTYGLNHLSIGVGYVWRAQ